MEVSLLMVKTSQLDLTLVGKKTGKNVLVSVGGQNGNWGNVLGSNATIANFVSSLIEIVSNYSLDGVDLDIEYFSAPPIMVVYTIVELRAGLDALGTGKKLITMSPECVTVYQAMGVPDAYTGAGYYNYMVPIINLADQYIDYYQPQNYNDWY